MCVVYQACYNSAPNLAPQFRKEARRFALFPFCSMSCRGQAILCHCADGFPSRNSTCRYAFTSPAHLVTLCHRLVSASFLKAQKYREAAALSFESAQRAETIGHGLARGGKSETRRQLRCRHTWRRYGIGVCQVCVGLVQAWVKVMQHGHKTAGREMHL